jgi:hypothetical protein
MTKAKKTADASDPRVDALIAKLRADRAIAPSVREWEAGRAAPGRAFGKNGLKVNGKLFALFTQGTLVVKLPKARVVELTESAVGEAFDPGHGRLMKEWLTVRNAKASWLDLVREAHRFVAS